MRSVKVRSDVLDMSQTSGDRWYVTNGITAVGPVNFELLARGVEAGKVPLESFVRHEAWKVWRPLAELTIVTGDANGGGDTTSFFQGGASAAPFVPEDITLPGGPTFSLSATNSEPGSDETWPGVYVGSSPVAFESGETLLHPPLLRPMDSANEVTSIRELTSAEVISIPRTPVPPLSFDEVDEVTAPMARRRLLRLSPAEVFGQSTSLEDALFRLLSAAVLEVSAEVALLHLVRDDGAFVLYAHGKGGSACLGQRTTLVDPAMMAAASGMCVLAEPSPGPAGRAIAARLSGLAPKRAEGLGGALMMPIRPRARLLAALELGRIKQFSPSEVADIGKLVDVLISRIEEAGWTS